MKTSSSQKIRLAIDVMGGDHGPSVVIPGAIRAAREKDISLILVGRDVEIREELEKYPIEGIDLEIVHADDVAEMKDKPSYILRRKKNTSIQIACNLVKESKADGVISAGHTGVTLACGIFSIGRIKGIDRPGLASIIPREDQPLILLDVGANIDSKPRHLVQFAIMADVFAKNILKVENPAVGLLNIGEEQGKGNVQVNEAYQLLKKTSLNFIGNIEGRDLFTNKVNIAVCDGFVGNIALKLCEGLGKSFSKALKKEIKRGIFTRLGGFLAKPAFKRLIRRFDYEEYGGAPLLGLKGCVIVCHGSSSKKSIAQATKMGAEFARMKITEKIKEQLEKHPEITRFYRLKNILSSTSITSKEETSEEETTYEDKKDEK
ncbi:phosphate acyltransferase PlsX [Desulfothermus okinawensis JCM 13304]